MKKPVKLDLSVKVVKSGKVQVKSGVRAGVAD
jgi:hypothetical protein